MHRRPELQQLAAGIRQLGVRRIKRVDRRRAGEQHQLSTHPGRLSIRSSHRFRGACDLTHREHLSAVPPELGGDCGTEQLTGPWFQALCGDHEGAQRPEGEQLHHGASFAAHLLCGGNQVAGHCDRCDLAARDLLSCCDSLSVHQREDRDVAEGVDGVYQFDLYAHEPAVGGRQASLALHRGLGLEPRSREGRGQPKRGGVLVEVARVQLHHVNIARLLDAGEVQRGEDCALAQVGTQVVDQHAPGHVLHPSLGPQSMRPHYWQHRFALPGPAVIRLYNTFSRAKELLTPADAGIVRIYSCGPTVYRYVHIGNLRTFMLPDLLCRALEYLGYRTHQVMNITDVGHLTDDTFDRGEDKMLVSARLEKKSPEEIAAYYTRAFREDAARVNIRPAADYPQASHYIPQMIELITKLIEKGHAYEVGGTVYYDIASFPAYGKLSRNSTDKLLAGARGEVDPRKRHPGDFTLWKAAGEHRLQVWDSPWGPGFPGWHIECSAMSMALLGDRFDIHTGGADNVFPHHEAEIAQSEGVAGHRVVGCWMHGGLLMLAGTRMAKSAGNFFRIAELEEQGIDPLAFRYLALQAKYRTKLNFSAEGLAGADRALRSLREHLADWSGGGGPPSADSTVVAALETRFKAAIADDLDLPAVMALVAELSRSALAPANKAQLLREWDRVLGLDLGRSTPILALPDGAAQLLASREKARAARDFATSDRLRDELAAMGVMVTDTAEGQRWKVSKA